MSVTFTFPEVVAAVEVVIGLPSAVVHLLRVAPDRLLAAVVAHLHRAAPGALRADPAEHLRLTAPDPQFVVPVAPAPDQGRPRVNTGLEAARGTGRLARTSEGCPSLVPVLVLQGTHQAHPQPGFLVLLLENRRAVDVVRRGQDHPTRGHGLLPQRKIARREGAGVLFPLPLNLELM